jgi:hypothetical protein
MNHYFPNLSSFRQTLPEANALLLSAIRSAIALSFAYSGNTPKQSHLIRQARSLQNQLSNAQKKQAQIDFLQSMLTTAQTERA